MQSSSFIVPPTLALTPAYTQIFMGLVTLRAQILTYREIFLFATIVSLIGAVAAYWIRVEKESDLKVIVE